jgi:hypothetical protein
MEALVNEIVERTALTRDEASVAARVAVDFIKERVPATTASRIDGVFAGEAVGETVSEIAGKIKGAFGR